jgi:hypothetical protein
MGAIAGTPRLSQALRMHATCADGWLTPRTTPYIRHGIRILVLAVVVEIRSIR